MVLGQNWANFQFSSLSSIYLWAEFVPYHYILWFSVVLRHFSEVQSCSATPYINLWVSYRLDHNFLWFWSIFSGFNSHLIKNEVSKPPRDSSIDIVVMNCPYHNIYVKIPIFAPIFILLFRCNMVNKENHPILHRYSGWVIFSFIYLAVTRTLVGTLWSLRSFARLATSHNTTYDCIITNSLC